MGGIYFKVFWGYFDAQGVWQPNPLLNINADEQRRQNEANGFDMTPRGPITRWPEIYTE